MLMKSPQSYDVVILIGKIPDVNKHNNEQFISNLLVINNTIKQDNN